MRRIGQEDSETEKKEREHEPLDAAEVVRDLRLRRWVDRLEETLSENSVVDDRLVDEPTEARRAVDLPAPFRSAGRAEENQVLESEHRFGFAITGLLSAKRAQGKATMMPDDGRRAKGDDVAFLLQAPAEIDIITRLAIFDIEPADRVECPPVEGHVTARDVLRHSIG